MKASYLGNDFIYLLQVLLSNNNKVGNPTIKLETRTMKSETGLLLTHDKVVNSSF